MTGNLERCPSCGQYICDCYTEMKVVIGQGENFCSHCGVSTEVGCSCILINPSTITLAGDVAQHICLNERETAIIFGVTGQDGSYLAEILLDKGYKVVGVARRSSSNNRHRVKDIISEHFEIVEGDVTDFSSVYRIINKYNPVQVYNLAAQSHVQTSFEQPLLTFDVTAKGAWNILETIRVIGNGIKFYQASSSEMFGNQMTYDYSYSNEPFQDENTPMHPQSPYAIAKLAAHHLTRLYRDAYGIFACSGILFNHESARRGELFVTKKICRYVARVHKYAQEPKLRLGNLESKRDWGYAKSHCMAMVMMLEHDKPDDYVIATGETHTVRDFLKEAFKVVGIENYMDYVVIDDKLKRPAEVPFLRGKSTKAEHVLGWKPNVTFKELIDIMVRSEIDLLRGN